MTDDSCHLNVLPFPLELRNIIYRHVVVNTYSIPPPLGDERSAQNSDSIGHPSRALSKLGILHVSQATRAEALQVLYAESTLSYRIDTTVKDVGYCSAPPTQKIMNSIRNLELEVSVPKLVDQAGILGEDPRQIFQEIVKQLTGASIVRNTLMIKLEDCDLSYYYGPATSLPFQAFQALGRFREIVVEVRAGRYQPHAPKAIPLTEVRAMIQPAIAERIDQGCERSMNHVKDALESAFGRVMEEGEVKDAYDVSYARYLKFRS